MSLWQTVLTGLRGISSHRLRSILTTLGILFGVAAVISTVGIGEASAASVNSRIASLGTNELTISPGATVSGGVFGAAGSASSLTMNDVTGLENHTDAPDIANVAPEDQSNGTIVSPSTNTTTVIMGSSTNYLAANARSVSTGTFFTAQQVKDHALVVVLGSTTASTLGAYPGEDVTIASTQFQVIGILASSGSSGFTNADDIAIIPIATDQDLISGPGAVQRIVITATSTHTLGSAYNEANQLLLQTHHITTPSTADFTITSQTSFLSTAQSVTTTLTLLLSSVAAISLIVGGIGVMNIMLVTVTERTSEIGLRKALGAAPSDIRLQFLIEAATLSGAGGVLGVLVALAGSAIIPHFTSITMDITIAPIVIAVVVAAGIGLVFGVYPAIRASHLTPIDALRSE